MIILGLNAYHADSSAAIFVNGTMIAATEEERSRRIKHWAGFPSEAIAFCLQEAGITLDQVDHIAIGRDPGAKFWNKLRFVSQSPVASLGFIKDRFFNRKKITSLEEEFEHHFAIDKALIKPKIHAVEHHRSHLASAFFASPFKEAALLSIDGSGDFTTTMTGTGSDNRIEVSDSIDFPHSLGVFYTAFTQLLGFPHYGDEYKIMGLAPYGNPRYAKKLEQVIHCTDDGLFQLDLSFFRSPHKGFVTYGDAHIPQIPSLYGQKMEELLGKARAKDQPLDQHHKDIAASVQKVTEQVIFHLLNHLHKKTGLNEVCIAGGVAQNSVANGKISRNTPFRQVYIPSAGHDAGISMGSALYVQHQLLNMERQPAIYSAYTGKRASPEEIETLLGSRNISYKKLGDAELPQYVAEKIANGAVVGWFTGRAEFGPRALGGRSIIADPRREDAKDLLNAKVKRRESFRPFAPSVLEEYAASFFDLNDKVPFMEKVFPVQENKRALIPAVTHVDGTGRLQTVSKDVSPRYHALISAFHAITGVPILLNTSFNENEPIVNSPAEALECFLRTQMDMLVLENYIVER
ncbi:carbamoyltransferase family protein [Sediminibacterium ginsengisoli]|uniref:Carbamoyltransferase n=1 Tax=Sediminibacterium ginsengisoli TaxID=413434 RepID=A0A1T4Q4N6_9BACT|nr:carbamoyltransferase C-terminal domain-containing protein [Sediminibacterium ginsengisoli]SJZ98733.1 carbamoyltransferase [Sediminibacterium ginsengisoli]